MGSKKKKGKRQANIVERSCASSPDTSRENGDIPEHMVKRICRQTIAQLSEADRLIETPKLFEVNGLVEIPHHSNYQEAEKLRPWIEAEIERIYDTKTEMKKRTWPSKSQGPKIIMEYNNSFNRIEEGFICDDRVCILSSGGKVPGEVKQLIESWSSDVKSPGIVIITTSLATLMNFKLEEKAPKDVVCELLVVIADHPSVVLCVVNEDSRDQSRYPNKLVGKVNDVVREYTDQYFVATAGTIEKEKLSERETFLNSLSELGKQMGPLYHKRNYCFDPDRCILIQRTLLAVVAVSDVPNMMKDRTGKNETKNNWFLTEEMFKAVLQNIDNDVVHGPRQLILELADRWQYDQKTLTIGDEELIKVIKQEEIVSHTIDSTKYPDLQVHCPDVTLLPTSSLRILVLKVEEEEKIGIPLEYINTSEGVDSPCYSSSQPSSMTTTGVTGDTLHNSAAAGTARDVSVRTSNQNININLNPNG